MVHPINAEGLVQLYIIYTWTKPKTIIIEAELVHLTHAESEIKFGFQYAKCRRSLPGSPLLSLKAFSLHFWPKLMCFFYSLRIYVALGTLPLGLLVQYVV